jgi:hypothetical protein
MLPGIGEAWSLRVSVPRRLTAFAITSASMTIDINACATIINLTQRVNGMTSVGLASGRRDVHGPHVHVVSTADLGMVHAQKEYL